MTGINLYIAKGVQSSNGQTMSMWKTNFNMPVPDLFAGGYPSSWYGLCNCYDLTGFCPGFEIVLAGSEFCWTIPPIAGGSSGGCARLTQKWYRNSDSTDIGFTFVRDISGITPTGSPCWYRYMMFTNIGVAPWEVCADGLYTVKAWAECLSGSGFDTAIGSCVSPITYDVCFYNVPTQTSIPYEGSIWVEGTQLAYINANQWKHLITGIDLGDSGSVNNAGSVWINPESGCEKIHWTGNDGHIYVPNFAVKQFASSFYCGGPTYGVSAPGKEGSIYVDNEFGWTHLSYIGSDGCKWLTGAGNCPYICPY